MDFLALQNLYLDDIGDGVKKRTVYYYAQLARAYLKGVWGVEVDMAGDMQGSFVESCEGLAPATVKSLRSFVNRCLKFGYEQGLVKEKYSVTLPSKRGSPPEVNNFTSWEMERLEDYILENGKPYHFGFLLSMYTGLRVGELLALRWSDVDFASRVLYVRATACDIVHDSKLLHFLDTPKTPSSRRTIPLSSHVIEILNVLKAGGRGEFVVASRKGTRVQVRAYQESFSRLLKRAGIKHRGTHSLRHSFATSCFHNGMDFKTLSELLGHSNPNITLSVYVHTDLETKRNALEMVTKKIAPKKIKPKKKAPKKKR